MSLRILIGHSLPGQRGIATALYVGDSGAKLEAAKAAAPATVGSFSILNNPLAIRKSNPRYNPHAEADAKAEVDVAVKAEGDAVAKNTAKSKK